jgi:DNA-binding CsgD family transcriptional regulator
MDEKFSLTEREKEMLRLLLKGKSNKEISAITFVSTETVKSHLQNIYKKLDVKSRLEAVTLFLKEKP